MERKRQRELALAALAVVLIATALWSVRSTSAPAPAEQVPSSPAPGANRPQLPGGPSGFAEVDLQALAAERPEPEPSNRNPFRFTPTAPPRQEPSVPNPQTVMVPSGPVEPPPLPRIPLKFIGLVDGQKDSTVGRVAILSDTRGVYYGREGEAIEGRYRIVKIGVESIELEYLDGRGRQTMRLTGQ